MSKIVYLGSVLVFLASYLVLDYNNELSYTGMILSGLFIVCYSAVLFFIWFANWIFDSW